MKTIKDFDYDLWATEENRVKKYYARVKSTGEETEIDHNVMKILLAEEKRMRREGKKSEENSTLSLDYIVDSVCENNDPYCLMDKSQNVSETVQINEQKERFICSLTDNQREVFNICIEKQLTVAEYAYKVGVSRQAVMKTILQIRKKAKNFFI